MTFRPSTIRGIDMKRGTGKSRFSLWRLGKFIFFLVLAIVAILALAATIGPEKMQAIEQKIDDGWWLVSAIRWSILAVLLLYLPYLLRRMEKRAERHRRRLANEYKRARAQDAAYETLAALNTRAEQEKRIAASYRAMFAHRRWIAAALIAVEVVLVQLPHLF